MGESTGELFIVIGGGCFGAHHVRHIEKGRRRGRISPDARIIMVDRNAHPPALDQPEEPRIEGSRRIGDNPFLTHVQSDWLEYMQANWDALPPDTQVVPAPVAPHLAFDWLVWSLRRHLGEQAIVVEPMEHSFENLPYEYLAPSGVRYISAADWICPTNCRAPHICPMTRDVRWWDLEDIVKDYAHAYPDLFAASVVLKPHFRVPGVDVLLIREYIEARDRLLDLARRPESAGKGVVVGTVSPCHGAVSLLRYASPLTAVSARTVQAQVQNIRAKHEEGEVLPGPLPPPQGFTALTDD
jgi:hypothetical protein